MNIKNNLRTQKTQKKLKAILLEKLGVKPITAITVQELCREAKINRTTFYIHYDNIYDLMRDIEVQMQQGVNKLFLDPERGVYNRMTDERLEQLIGYIHENAVFYRILLNDLNSLNLIDDDLSRVWEKQLEPALRKKADATEAQLQYRFEYFNSGLRGIIRKWLNAGCPETPAELTQVIKNVVQV